MTVDSYTTIWNRVLLRCPSASAFLAQDWVRNAFRQIAERRPWSWKVKFTQLLVPASYTTGTVTVTNNSAAVVGSGTTFTSAMVGRQFRIGNNTPIYTIMTFNSATSITLDAVYGGTTAAGSTYQIYQAYFVPPSDFKSWLSVWDPAMAWQLHLNVQQQELNLVDPQRARFSQPYVVASLDYGIQSSGVIGATPRFEIWPHQTSQYVLPALYICQPPDLDETSVVLPTIIRGDVLLELALADAARWPGPSQDKPNPYRSDNLAIMHERRAEKMIMELETKDDELYESDLTYAYPPLGWPFASVLGDAAWVQSHAI